MFVSWSSIALRVWELHESQIIFISPISWTPWFPPSAPLNSHITTAQSSLLKLGSFQIQRNSSPISISKPKLLFGFSFPRYALTWWKNMIHQTKHSLDESHIRQILIHNKNYIRINKSNDRTVTSSLIQLKRLKKTVWVSAQQEVWFPLLGEMNNVLWSYEIPTEQNRPTLKLM